MRVTLVTDLDERAFGESVYSKKTPQERFTEIIVRDLLDLTNSATRRIEQMSASLLFTGAFSYRLDSGETESLDYGTITPIVPTIKWDARGQRSAGRSAKRGQSDRRRERIDARHARPRKQRHDDVPLASAVLDTLNKLNVSLGALAPSKPSVGTSQFVGRVYRPYLDLYGYAESYEHEDESGDARSDGS